MLLHFRDDVHIVSNVTVSHEANDANVSLIVRWRERGFDRRHHLSAAIARARAEKCLRLAEVCSCCRYWLWKQYARIACERDQVERVKGIEIVERELHRLLRLLDRKALHRA